MSKDPPRARSERRRKERELRKTARALDKLAAEGEGGGPERAIAVSSPAVVELRARAFPCVRCGGELELREQTAEFRAAEQLRLCRLVCRTCHAPRELWFRLGRVLPS